MRKSIGNQGEIRVDQIDNLPINMTTAGVERVSKGFVISHSESGHHHLLSGDVEVMERTNDVPSGMKIIYAIVKEPSRLLQDAATPHKPIDLDPGIYEMRIKREFDPFTEQARQVAD